MRAESPILVHHQRHPVADPGPGLRLGQGGRQRLPAEDRQPGPRHPGQLGMDGAGGGNVHRVEPARRRHCGGIGMVGRNAMGRRTGDRLSRDGSAMATTRALSGTRAPPSR